MEGVQDSRQIPVVIGRALMGNPTLLLMDEPLEGLAPVIVDALLDGLDRLKRESELALLLVEQHCPAGRWSWLPTRSSRTAG
jgi:ABC-type branched-subunit amino acid transport system ATPase component